MPAPAQVLEPVFIPEWLRNLWYEVASGRYTGPLTLHFSEGRVKQIETRHMRKPEELKS